MRPTVLCAWDQKLIDPSKQRHPKPRTSGCTMIMDKGMGLTAFQDTLQLAAAYIDFIKLGCGTAALTPIPVLLEKCTLAKKYEVHLYPGGTFFEMAYSQQRVESYFESLKELQIEWVEISNGTIELPLADRANTIEQAQSYGLKVITEIGKKAAGSVLPIADFAKIYTQDQMCGATYMIIEGRETGINVGIYNRDGEINCDYVDKLLSIVRIDEVIWDTPQRKQQVQMLQRMGYQVNLGNIPPADTLLLECLRRGLYSDTFVHPKREI
jgi:phosphosulfolactate synthase